MPRERAPTPPAASPSSSLPATVDPTPSTALVIPDDVRADLLRAQGDSIETMPKLPRAKVMPQGVNLFEFDDEAGATASEIVGVVLGYHPRNVLWDKPFGSQAEGEDVLPGCSANDGRTGVPREGFVHAGLQRAAVGTETIACTSCPYNQWQSAPLIGKQGKGKACTNQRALFIGLADRELPVELVLPPTSLVGFDEYLTALLNRAVPIQAVRTVFRLERKERGNLRWSQVTFQQGQPLTGDEFAGVMAKRTRFLQLISPNARVATMETVEATVLPDGDDDVDGNPPF